MRKPCVLMIGTGVTTMGGIATVVQGYIGAGLFERANVIYVRTHGDGSALKKLALALLGYGHFLWLLLRHRVRLLHIHMSSRASFWRKLPIVLIARLFRYPYLIHLHGSEFMIFYEQESGGLGKSLVRSTFDRAFGVLALSPEWQDNVASFSTNPNIEVFPNGVPVEKTRPAMAPHSDRLVMLFLGRLGKRKGIYDVLDALVRILPDNPGFELIAAGDGEIDEVKARVASMGLSDNVQVPGWIGPEDKARFLASSHCFLLPSHNEGLPMSLLEAMAAGLPIVCSNAGGIPLAVSDGVEGLVVDAGDVTALEQALRRVLDDQSLRESLAEAAYQRAARDFSVDACVARLLDIYATFGVHSDE